MLRRNKVNIMILVSLGMFVLNKLSTVIFEFGSDLCKYFYFGTGSLIWLLTMATVYVALGKGVNRRLSRGNVLMAMLVSCMAGLSNFINYGEYSYIELIIIVLCISGIIINTIVNEVRTRH